MVARLAVPYLAPMSDTWGIQFNKQYTIAMSAIIRAKVIVGLIGGVPAGLAAAVLVLDLKETNGSHRATLPDLMLR